MLEAAFEHGIELIDRVREAIELCLEVEGSSGEMLDFVGVQRVAIE